MSKEEKRFQMLELVARWRDSGMTQAEFANANNLTIHTFKYWLYKKKVSNNPPSTGFVQLNDFLPRNDVFIIRYPHGVELQFPAYTPLTILKGLINI